MRLRVNGEWAQIEAQTISDVLDHYALRDKKVVVEANGTIVERELWDTAEVKDEMILEIVHFVGGG